MALSFVEGKVVDSGTTPATTANFTNACASGQLYVVYMGTDGGATGLITSVTDTLGNTWHQVTGMDIANAGGTLSLDAWYSATTKSGTNAITVNFSDTLTNCNVVAQYFNGFTGTPTFDKVQHSSNTSSTTVTSGATATTTQATELVVGGGVYASTATTYTLGTGYTNLTQNNVAARGTGMESKVVSSTGAQTATFTLGAARVNIGGVATFYDGSSNPAPNVSDSESLTESIKMLSIANVNVNDTEGTSENVALTKVLNVNVSDTLNTAENVPTPSVSYGIDVEPANNAYFIPSVKIVNP